MRMILWSLTVSKGARVIVKAEPDRKDRRGSRNRRKSRDLSPEAMIKKFNRLVKKERIIEEFKEKRFYKNKSQKRREKSERARRRLERERRKAIKDKKRKRYA